MAESIKGGQAEQQEATCDGSDSDVVMVEAGEGKLLKDKSKGMCAAYAIVLSLVLAGVRCMCRSTLAEIRLQHT